MHAPGPTLAEAVRAGRAGRRRACLGGGEQREQESALFGWGCASASSSFFQTHVSGGKGHWNSGATSRSVGDASCRVYGTDGEQSVKPAITLTEPSMPIGPTSDDDPSPPIIHPSIHTLARSTLRRAYRSRASVSSAGSGASECRRPWEKRRVKSAGRGAGSCGGPRACRY